MAILFSKSTNCFYDSVINAGNIPFDVIEVSRELHYSILQSQYTGKQVSSDKNGYPIIIETPVIAPSWNKIKSRRNTLLKESDWVDLPNSPVKNKQAWLEYRQKLRDIPQKFKKTQDIVWPKSP